MKMLAPLCLLLAIPALHAAEVNKCVDANGNTILTDEPCYSLKRKSAATPTAPAPSAREAPLEKPATTPPTPILPPPEQLVRPAPMPAPAEKPQQ
jgi:hypothetical protein